MQNDTVKGIKAVKALWRIPHTNNHRAVSEKQGLWLTPTPTFRGWHLMFFASVKQVLFCV